MKPEIKIEELVCVTIRNSQNNPVVCIPVEEQTYRGPVSNPNFRVFGTESGDTTIVQHVPSGDVLVTEYGSVVDFEEWANRQAKN